MSLDASDEEGGVRQMRREVFPWNHFSQAATSLARAAGGDAA
ncbi:hypothetical protein WDJ51_02570 [Rathayibacter sp. YIM 133350]